MTWSKIMWAPNSGIKGRKTSRATFTSVICIGPMFSPNNLCVCTWLSHTNLIQKVSSLQCSNMTLLQLNFYSSNISTKPKQVTKFNVFALNTFNMFSWLNKNDFIKWLAWLKCKRNCNCASSILVHLKHTDVSCWAVESITYFSRMTELRALRIINVQNSSKIQNTKTFRFILAYSFYGLITTSFLIHIWTPSPHPLRSSLVLSKY